jgi:hypothetical protein
VLAGPRLRAGVGQTGSYSGPKVLVLYLKRPPAKSWRGETLCRGRFRYSDLKEAAPGGLWDLYLDEPVLIVCEFAVAVRALGFQ